MPLPPDETARRAFIAAYMAGARAEWAETADQVQLLLGAQTRQARAVFEGVLRALGLEDLVSGDGPTVQESDAARAYQAREDGDDGAGDRGGPGA